MEKIKFALIAIVFGIIGGAVSDLAISGFTVKSQNNLIEDFYLTENAVHISPHGLRGKMDKGINDFVLIDLRSQEEYEKEHIIGAVNIPAYKDKDTSDYGSVDRIVNSFKDLISKNPGKDIIVYCYSIPCMTGRKIGKILAEKDIYVKLLGIGWNEWRHFWNLWNHEHEWNQTIVTDYIASGKEPGIPKMKEVTQICTEGSFGC